MLGGNVSYDGNISDGVAIFARIVSNAVVAPLAAPRKFAYTHTATGVHTFVFDEGYAQFLGAQVTVEGSAVPALVATAFAIYSWTAATRTLVVRNFTAAATPLALDVNFALTAQFAENVVA